MLEQSKVLPVTFMVLLYFSNSTDCKYQSPCDYDLRFIIL